MNLYQFEFNQPHYVVAMNYGDAACTIAAAGYSQPQKIECLGPYILISKVILPASMKPREEK